MAVMLKVSRANQKLGVNIPSINLQPCRSCRSDAPCAKLCYGKHGRFVFPNVKATLDNNSDLWEQDPTSFELQATAAAFGARFFRWHSTGDIVSPAYFAMMVRVAERCPGTEFLCFTKQYEIVNEYAGNIGFIPRNLHIVFSAWGKWVPDNPHQFPMAFVRLKKQECPIPDWAIECKGYCGDCVQGNKHCWNLTRGECVVFNQH